MTALLDSSGSMQNATATKDMVMDGADNTLAPIGTGTELAGVIPDLSAENRLQAYSDPSATPILDVAGASVMGAGGLIKAGGGAYQYRQGQQLSAKGAEQDDLWAMITKKAERMPC